MLYVWVHGCDPGRLSDGSRLALCQTLSIGCPIPIFFSSIYYVLCVVIVPFVLSSLSSCGFVKFSCSRWSFLCRCSTDLFPVHPAEDHVVPDWQPRILPLGMVEARSVNVKNTTTNAEIPNKTKTKNTMSLWMTSQFVTLGLGSSGCR